MSTHLLIETTDRAAVLVAAIGITAAAKALALVLRTWIEQASRTRRLIKALENAKPHQRPGIIMACSQLEARSAAKPGGETADDALPAHGHPRPPMLIVQNRRGHERDGD